MHPYWRFSVRLVAFGFVLAAPSASVLAADNTTTGIVAAMGLQAASGKTTVSDGGKTEAALLYNRALQNAAMKILEAAGLGHTNKENSSHPILILGRNDTVPLAAGTSVDRTLQHLNQRLESCTPAKPSTTKELASPPKVQPTLADVAAMLATDKTFGSVTVETDDRPLIYAIQRTAADSSVHIRSPADLLLVPDSNQIIQEYEVLSEHLNHPEQCKSDNAAAALANAKSVVEKLEAPGPDGMTPLLEAARQWQLAQNEQNEQNETWILRVAIEHGGGTTITRSNIWYTLGFPGAATIGAGLIASFRLTDPKTADVIAAGEVACAVPQQNLTRVADRLNKTKATDTFPVKCVSAQDWWPAKSETANQCPDGAAPSHPHRH